MRRTIKQEWTRSGFKALNNLMTWKENLDKQKPGKGKRKQALGQGLFLEGPEEIEGGCASTRGWDQLTIVLTYGRVILSQGKPLRSLAKNVAHSIALGIGFTGYETDFA